MQVSEKIMEQVQVYASTYSLAGGRFDTGNMMQEANDAKEELRTMLEAALAQQEPVAVQVKPLEWEVWVDGWQAHTPFGSYTVEPCGDRWLWCYCFDEYYDEDQIYCDTPDEGKQAAWGHWLERVSPIVEPRSALAPVSQPVAWLPTARWEQMTSAEPWLTNVVYSEDQSGSFPCEPLFTLSQMEAYAKSKLEEAADKAASYQGCGAIAAAIRAMGERG